MDILLLHYLHVILDNLKSKPLTFNPNVNIFNLKTGWDQLEWESSTFVPGGIAIDLWQTAVWAGRVGCCCQLRTESGQVLVSITRWCCKTAAPVIIDLMALNGWSSSGRSRLWQLSHAWYWHGEEVTWLRRGKVRQLKGVNYSPNQ